jgi:hypothetical protein
VNNELCAKKSNGAAVCVTSDQLAALLAGASGTNQSPAAAQPGPNATSTLPGSVTQNGAASTTAPTIAINGDNPAIIHVGDTYADLGATITGPQADLNLGIKTFLNGTLVSTIVLDTSSQATDTIEYVASDSEGVSATSTRTVIIDPVATLPTAPPSGGVAASSTEATSGAQ